MASPSERRRGFIKLCAGLAASVAARPRMLQAAAAEPLRRYDRTRLVLPDGAPLAAGDLQVGESYVFHYPYVTTPCFLLNLGQAPTRTVSLATAAGDRYRAPDGVGPRDSVVAFSAICAHKMSHPAPSVSFINYRAGKARFIDRNKRRREQSGVIFCCSERSVYDPSAGARVLGGPAPQPLAAIVLEYDAADGALTAVGTRGGEMFDGYFEKFGFRLQLEHGISDVRARTGERSSIYTVAEYCETLVNC